LSGHEASAYSTGQAADSAGSLHDANL